MAEAVWRREARSSPLNGFKGEVRAETVAPSAGDGALLQPWTRATLLDIFHEMSMIDTNFWSKTKKTLKGHPTVSVSV